MKTLTFHCKRFESKDIDSKNAPVKTKDSVVVLITFEVGDKSRTIKRLTKEIIKMSLDFNEKFIVIFPFSHLSSNLLNPEQSLSLLDNLLRRLKETNLEVIYATFGTDKEVLLNIIGHPDNARFRSF